MSSIAAGTTSGSALVSTGDTTGNLVLQVNGTTPSVSLAANGAIGFGSSPSYGTAGQALLSNGSSAAPSWGSASPMVLLSTATASSSASLNFTSLISSTYANYTFTLEKILPATNATALYLQTSTTNGASWDTTSVYITSNGTNTATGPAVVASNISNSVSNTYGAMGVGGTMVIRNAAAPSSTSPLFIYRDSTFYVADAAGLSGSTPTLLVYRAAVVNAVRFILSSGNITSGTIRMYGWN